MKPIFGLLIVVACLTGCYYDHANLVYPKANCVITNVTYSSTITSILRANCYGCHSGNASAGGGIALDNYTSLKVYVSNGQLMNSINHTGGIAGMPLNASQLLPCDISTIQAWVSNGAPNN